MRNPGETIDVSLPDGLHPYGVSLWDETFTQVASAYVNGVRLSPASTAQVMTAHVRCANVLCGYPVHVQGPDQRRGSLHTKQERRQGEPVLHQPGHCHGLWHSWLKHDPVVLHSLACHMMHAQVGRPHSMLLLCA